MKDLNDWQINAKAQALTVDSSTGNNSTGIMQAVKIMQDQAVFSQTVVVASSADTPDFIPIEPDLIDGQFNEVRNNGEVKAVLIGQLNTVETLTAVMHNLNAIDFGPIVLNPVDTTNNLTAEIKQEILPHTHVLVANAFQASQLTGMAINSELDALAVAQKLQELGVANVLLNNLTKDGQIQDLVVLQNQTNFWLPYAKFEAEKSFGSVPIIAASITADLAKGTEVKTAIENGHQFVQNFKIDL